MFNTCIVPGCHDEDLSDLDQTTGLCGGCARSGAPALAGEVQRLTADLATARRLLPARYIASDGSILDPERCTPHAPDCAECGRGRAHDEGCLALLATPAEGAADREAENEYLRAERDRARDEVARLIAELEEARLTFAAEQGKPEGAPSEGWAPNYETGQFPSYQWRKTFSNGERVTVDYFPVERRWEWCFMDRPNRHNFPWVRDRFEANARAAMRRVDETLPAAHPSTPAPAPE